MNYAIGRYAARIVRATAIVGIVVGFAGGAGATDLSVTVTGVQAGPGSIRVALYSDPKTFRHEDKAYRVQSAPVETGYVMTTFKDVPPGRYAAIAYHDANDNKKLDLTLGMFPSEGWGLSNDPTIIGPPSFEPSAFDVGEQATNIVVRLHY